jgi:hypothetical protein
VDHAAFDTAAKSLRHCDNYVTTPEFRDVLTDQVADIHALKADAESRGWTDEAARHDRVAHVLTDHLHRLDRRTLTHNGLPDPRGPDNGTAQQGDQTSSRRGGRAGPCRAVPVRRYRLDPAVLVVAGDMSGAYDILIAGP